MKFEMYSNIILKVTKCLFHVQAFNSFYIMLILFTYFITVYVYTLCILPGVDEPTLVCYITRIMPQFVSVHQCHPPPPPPHPRTTNEIRCSVRNRPPNLIIRKN
jgi:hypothetical protein